MAVDRSSRDGKHVWLLAMLADRSVLRMLGKDNFTAGLCLAKDGSSSSALFELAAPYRTVSLIEGLHKIGDAVMDKHGKLAVAVQGASNDITDVRLYQHLEGFLTQSTAHVCVTLQSNAFHYHNARLYSGAAHFTLCGDSSFPVQAFGDNRHFQQGHSAGVRHSGASKVVARSVSVFEGMQSDNGESPIRKIACGDLHTACLAGDGALYMAGSGKFNQCGGFSGSEATLVQFQDDAGNEDADIDVLDVACGSNYTVLLTSKGVMSAGSSMCCTGPAHVSLNASRRSCGAALLRHRRRCAMLQADTLEQAVWQDRRCTCSWLDDARYCENGMTFLLIPNLGQLSITAVRQNAFQRIHPRLRLV